MIIRNRDTGYILWEDKLTESYIDDMLNVVRRIRNFIIGKTEPLPTSNIYKCYKCKMKNLCDKFKDLEEKHKKLKNKIINLQKRGYSERKIAKMMNMTRWKIRRILGKC